MGRGGERAKKKGVLASTLSGRDSVWKFSRCRKCVQKMQEGHRYDNTVGRAQRGDWVEGVIFKAEAVARKAGPKGAGLPMDAGTWLGWEQG